jgi:hypothetical protein
MVRCKSSEAMQFFVPRKVVSHALTLMGQQLRSVGVDVLIVFAKSVELF